MFLLFRPADSGSVSEDEVVAAVDRAIAAANETVPPRTIVGGVALRAVRGVAATLFWDGQDGKVIRPWLTAFTDHLAGAGLRGKVGPHGEAYPRLEGLVNLNRWFPTAFVGFRLAEYLPMPQILRGWLVDADTTRRIARHAVSWAGDLPGVECWPGLGSGDIQVRDPDVTEFLCSSAALSTSSNTVTYRSSNPFTLNRITSADLGEFVYQSLKPDADWPALVDAMTALLLMDPEAADVGMIKNARPGAVSWQHLDTPMQKPVRVLMDFENSRHLWDEYVIDAHGISLLTAKHLSHANDLSNWTVDHVAPDRYLVKATDLEPWFRQAGPDEPTLARARADFGDMILTWDTILTKRGPYTSSNMDIVGR